MAKKVEERDPEKMRKILADFKKKMKQIDDEKTVADKKKIPKFDPLKAKAMIEEIVVPKLELIKEGKEKTLKMKV